MPPALWGYSVPIQSKSIAIIPAPSGYIPFPWSHGPRELNRPRPGWPCGPGPIGWHSRPLFMAPRPGACILWRGRMMVNIPGAGYMGPGGYCRMYPMVRGDISACQSAGNCAGGPPPWGRGLCRLPGPPGRSRWGAVPMPGTGGVV